MNIGQERKKKNGKNEAKFKIFAQSVENWLLVSYVRTLKRLFLYASEAVAQAINIVSDF